MFLAYISADTIKDKTKPVQFLVELHPIIVQNFMALPPVFMMILPFPCPGCISYSIKTS